MKPKLLFGGLAVALVALCLLFFPRGNPPTGIKVVFAEGSQPIAAPVYVAAAKGFFSDEGLDVQLVAFPTGKLCLDAVLGGKAELGTVAETPVMHATFKDQPVRIVATMHRSRENTFLVARKDRGIESGHDLEGKVVGVPIGTNAEYALGAFLSKAGLSDDDVQLINLSPPEMVGPLMKGDIVAASGWQPHIGRAEVALGENALRLSFDEVYEETYNIVAKTTFTEDHPDVLVKALIAIDRAIEFMEKNESETVAIVATRIGMKEEELRQLWNIYHFGLDLRQSLVDTLVSQGNWAVTSGHQSGDIPDMRQFFFTDALRAVRPSVVEIQ